MNALVIIIVLLAILEVATKKGDKKPRESYSGPPSPFVSHNAAEVPDFDAARFAAAARSSQSPMEDVGLDQRTWAGSHYLRDYVTPLTARVVSRPEDMVPGTDFVSAISL